MSQVSPIEELAAEHQELKALLEKWPEKSQASFGSLLGSQAVTVLANVREAVESDIQMVERFQIIHEQLKRGGATETATVLGREGRKAVFNRFRLYEKLFTILRKSMESGKD